MKSKIIILIFFTNLSLGITAQFESSLSDGAEPFIAKDPNNPDQLAIAFMDNGLTTNFSIYYSHDGGTTWDLSDFDAQQLYNSLFGPVSGGVGDPVLNFDSDGVLHFTYIMNGRMLYVRSMDAGITFAPSSVAAHRVDSLAALDRQWMASDHSGGINDGNLYLSAKEFSINPDKGMDDAIVLYTKPSDSIAFNMNSTPIFESSTGEVHQFSNIKVDEAGRIHASCMRFNQSNLEGSYLYARSEDGGQTFSSPLILGTGTTSLNGENNIIHYGDNSAVSLAVGNNNVYICWSDYSNASVKSYYTYSNDGGNSFSVPIEFGPLTVPGANYHIMPNVAAEDNQMSMSCYVADSITLQTLYYVANSSDSGSTFNNVQVVSEGTTHFNTIVANNFGFYGHYNSSVMIGCETHSVWCDGRTQLPIVYHANVDPCSVGLFEQSPVSELIKVGSIYPNPSHDFIHVEISTKKTHLNSWEIADMSGKVLCKGNIIKSFENLDIDINDLATGTYLLTLRFKNNMIVTRKFSKQ